MEGQNFTLKWNYSFGGSFVLAQFVNNTASANDEIGKAFAPGSINVNSKYQARFRGQATNTEAELTILAVLRSDKGNYGFELISTGSSTLNDGVDVIVLCKY